ncbi:MAG: N-acetyltransferase family protein [Alphaproteobacteria bacterium]|nr:GNAT family N-acetyltransferase [Alphaproteobacteria bacterium]TAD87074.1 MAG: N-acetyltransferase family protein [Alphaproteobacteria bacterium]
MTGVVIRAATVSDAAAVQAIYAHHVATGYGSFDEMAPSVAAMAQRIVDIQAHPLPFLIAERDGRVGGYGYLGPFRPRPAYRFTLENSVYVAPDQVGQGIGRAVMQALIAHAEAGPWRQMIAVIGGGTALNPASVALHRSLGFVLEGELVSVGWKHGRWVDLAMMRRGLGDGDRQPPADPRSPGNDGAAGPGRS